jgi:DNA-binding MarR family transcriptional regulator
MGIDPSVLVTMLNPLEEGGFLKRRRDTADRRRHTVLLTDTGKKQLTKAARAQREAEDALFAGLDHDQREHLREVLLALWYSSRDGRESPEC